MSSNGGGGPNVGTCSLSTALTLPNHKRGQKKLKGSNRDGTTRQEIGGFTRGMMKALPKTIKTRINQFAHRSAQRHALMVRDSTLGKLQGMADDGATLPDLFAALAAIEATADASI